MNDRHPHKNGNNGQQISGSADQCIIIVNLPNHQNEHNPSVNGV